MIRAGIFLAAAGSILAVSDWTVSIFGLPKFWTMSLANVLIWSGIIYRWVKGGQRFHFIPLMVPAILFLMASLVSSMFSVDYTLSLLGNYRIYTHSMATYVSLFFLAFGIAYTRDEVDAGEVIPWFLWPMILAGIFAGFQSFGLDKLLDYSDFSGNSTSTIGHPVYYGMAITLLFPLAIREALWSSEERDLVGWAAIASMVAGAYFTHKRGVWLGMAVSTFVYLALVQVVPMSRRAWVLLAALVLTGCIWYSPKLLGNRSDAGRVAAWAAAGKAVESSPMIGSGPGTFRLMYRKHKAVGAVEAAGSSRFVHFDAHNDVLHIAATLGAVGIIAYILLLVGFFACANNGLNNPTRSDESAAIIAGIVGLFALMKLQPLSISVEILAAVLIGMLMRSDHIATVSDIRLPRVLMSSAAVCLVAIFAFASVMVASDFYRKRVYNERIDPLYRAQFAEKAGRWTPWSLETRQDQVQTIYPLPHRMAPDAAVMVMDIALGVCDKALWWHPNDPEAHAMRGTTLLVKGHWLKSDDKYDAMISFKKAQSLAPQFIPLMLQRAALARVMRDKSEYLRAMGNANSLARSTGGKI